MNNGCGRTRIAHSRRDFLRLAGGGIGMLALNAMLCEQGLTLHTQLGSNPMAPRAPHFPARARSVIWLFMNGGPSHIDTWDYKPGLDKARRAGTRGLRPHHRLFQRRRSARS